MLFAYPKVLWLLALSPATAYLAWRGDGNRRGWVASLRAAQVLLIVLAMSRPVFPRQSAPAVGIAVIDVDPAAGGLATARLDTGVTWPPAAVVAFAARAEVVEDPTSLGDARAVTALVNRLSVPLWSDDRRTGGANLAAALQLAAAQVPPDGRGSVRLYADGRCDHGDAAAEAYRLALRGIAVRVVPPGVRVMAATTVRRVALPATAELGQTVDADVEVDSAAGGPATVRLTAGDDAPVVVTSELSPGPNHVRVPLPMSRPGLTPVRAALGPVAGGTAGDVRAAVFVAPASRVLLVQDRAGAGVAQALAASLGTAARVDTESAERLAGRSLDGVGTVVLADVPADHLSAATQARLGRAVLDGTGLLVTGAARSFGPGGYDESPLAPLLPVRMPQPAEQIDPSVALVLVIDTSGSMGSGGKIDLAKAVARLAVSHLRPQDKVGIVEFYGGKRWAAPIQSAAARSAIERTLDRLTAGGNTTMYAAIEEAAFGLRNVRAQSKHVMVISDGFVEDAPFGPLVGRMADDGVAVSAVQVGADRGPNLMPAIARWGDGRFYDVADEFAVPDVSFKQPRKSVPSPLVRTPSAVVGDGGDPLVRDVAGAAWSPVQGYVRTVAKPTADVLLRTRGGDPLLVRWRYGSGFVAALPTQLGSAMTGGLESQPQFARLLAGLVRQIGTSRGAPLRVSAVVRPAGVEVDVVAIDAGPARADRSLTVELSDDRGRVRRTTPPAPAIEPGHWDVLLRGVTAGTYTLTAAVGEVTAQAAVAVPPPDEASDPAADRLLLDRIAGFAPLAAARAARLPALGLKYVDLQPELAASAVVLLLAQVALRRWPVPVRRPL